MFNNERRGGGGGGHVIFKKMCYMMMWHVNPRHITLGPHSITVKFLKLQIT